MNPSSYSIGTAGMVATGSPIRPLTPQLDLGGLSQNPLNNPTPTPTPSTGYKVPLPPVVPTAAIGSDATQNTVLNQRNQLQMAADTLNSLKTGYSTLDGKMTAPPSIQSSPFNNPEDFINQLLLRRPTETAESLDAAYKNQADSYGDIGRDLSNAQDRLSDEFGVVDLNKNLASTRDRIAERTKVLRETIRDFETNAERRGVAREFVNSEKAKVNADAAAELADLAIIESSQLGNLTQAQADIKTALDSKKDAFLLENQALTLEIDRLTRLDTKEGDKRKEELTLALSERTRLFAEASEQEKQKLTFLSEAAANGADEGTLQAILNSQTSGQAGLLAGPWIGRLDRLNTQSTINSRNSSGSGGGSPTLWSAGLQLTRDDIAQGTEILKSNRGPDGFTDSGKYKEQLDFWVGQGGDADDFFKNYNPAYWLRPGDTTIDPYIKSKMQQSSVIMMPSFGSTPVTQ